MSRNSRIKELKRIQTQVDRLRTDLDFSPSGVIWYANSSQAVIMSRQTASAEQQPVSLMAITP